MKTSELHNEYLQLLKQYGINFKYNEPSLLERLKDLHRMSKDKNKFVRIYARQTLDALDLLSKMTGENIINGIRKGLIEDKTGELEESVNDIINLLDQENINLPFAIYFNVFPHNDLNAKLHPTKYGVLCLFNTGFLRLFYNITFSCCYIIHSHKLNTNNNISDEIYSLCSVVLNILKYHLHDDLSYQIFKNKKMDPLGVIVADILYYSMKTFVVSHEIGHMVLGHLLNKNNKTILEQKEKINPINLSYNQEYDADKFAQNSLINIDKVNKRSFPIAVGGISFFTIHNLFLLVTEKLDIQTFNYYYSSLTHPPSIDRLLSLQKYLKKNTEKEYYQDIFKFNSGLWSILKLLKLSKIDTKDNQVIITINDEKYFINHQEKIKFK